MAETKVVLCDYKGIKIQKREVVVTEAEIDAEMDRARSYAATTIDKDEGEAAMGDQATIDFVGYINDEPFPGGDGTNYPLVLGSNTFIPGFEEQLVGAKVGDTVDVKVPFPTNYHEPAYAGKDALFKVIIKSLRKTITPEMSDEVVQRISPCKTVPEFREYVRKQITDYKENQAQEAKENEILAYLVNNSEITISEEEIMGRAEILKENLNSQLRNQQSTLEDYLDYNNITMEMFEESAKKDAHDMLKGQAVLGAVAEAENFSYTEQELEREIFEMAMMYRMDVDELKEMMGEIGQAMVGQDMLNKMALDYLVANVVEE